MTRHTYAESVGDFEEPVQPLAGVTVPMNTVFNPANFEPNSYAQQLAAHELQVMWAAARAMEITRTGQYDRVQQEMGGYNVSVTLPLAIQTGQIRNTREWRAQLVGHFYEELMELAPPPLPPRPFAPAQRLRPDSPPRRRASPRPRQEHRPTARPAGRGRTSRPGKAARQQQKAAAAAAAPTAAPSSAPSSVTEGPTALAPGLHPGPRGYSEDPGKGKLMPADFPSRDPSSSPPKKRTTPTTVEKAAAFDTLMRAGMVPPPVRPAAPPISVAAAMQQASKAVNVAHQAVDAAKAGPPSVAGTEPAPSTYGEGWDP